jgi:hypothetical protein
MSDDDMPEWQRQAIQREAEENADYRRIAAEEYEAGLQREREIQERKDREGA